MILNGNSTHICPMQASRNCMEVGTYSTSTKKNTGGLAHWLDSMRNYLLPRVGGGGGREDYCLALRSLDTGCEFWENNTEDYNNLNTVYYVMLQ